MRNTKYMAELFSLGFLSLDTPLYNLLSCMVYCRSSRFRFMLSQVQVLTYNFFPSWEIKIELYVFMSDFQYNLYILPVTSW